MTQPPAAVDGRTRRKVEAMRRVQAAALDLFERRGFAAVTVEQVATAAGVGAATVYRNFGGKERLVLWDEYDPLLLDAVAAALAEGAPPLAAVHAGVARALARVYREDGRRILRRARLTLETPALRAQTVGDLHALKLGLAGLLAPTVPEALTRTVLAAAAVGALEAALDAWVAGAGRTPLGRLLDRAFRALEVGPTAPTGGEPAGGVRAHVPGRGAGVGRREG
jgi:AcrR family transcriptional regulator